MAVLKYFVDQYCKEVDEGTLNPKRKPQFIKGAPRPQYILNPKVHNQLSSMSV